MTHKNTQILLLFYTFDYKYIYILQFLSINFFQFKRSKSKYKIAKTSVYDDYILAAAWNSK